MALLYGLHMEHQGSGAAIPHILSYLTARTVADDGIFELWNGATNAARVLRVTQEGQIQGQDGLVSKPTYSFASEKGSGLYRIGASNLGVAIAGTKIVAVAAAGVTVTGTLTSTGALAATTGTFSGIVSVDDTTDTTSTITGSIHTDGGVGIAKALWVGTTSRLVGAVRWTVR